MQTCIEPEFGSVNQDGYVRQLNRPRSKGGRLVMAHRQAWENQYGPIPQTHEINHKCKNRKCINLNHLECIERSEHRSLDNKLRYKDREQQVLKFVKDNPHMSQSKVASVFGITQPGVSLILKRNRHA